MSNQAYITLTLGMSPSHTSIALHSHTHAYLTLANEILADLDNGIVFTYNTKKFVYQIIIIVIVIVIVIVTTVRCHCHCHRHHPSLQFNICFPCQHGLDRFTS